jgi:hypothetical protein
MIRCQLDAALSALLRAGRIDVGHKLAVCGATLSNAPDSGVTPLEALNPT